MLGSLVKKLAIFFLSLAIMYVAVKVGYAAYKRYVIEFKISNLKAQVEELESRNQQIVSLLRRLENKDYLLLKTKETFNLKEDGEEVAIAPSKETETKKDQARKGKESPATWQKWWKIFFGAR